jgi:hypothetical protein
VYVDFVEVEEVDNRNFILVICDGLSRFIQAVPTNKSISGEKTFKKIFKHWIVHHGLPHKIVHDCDVRFASFWNAIMKSLGVIVKKAPPRSKGTTSLVEKMNDVLLKNLRTLLSRSKSKRWTEFLPYAVWSTNEQVDTRSGLTPSELFLGHRGWNPHQAFPSTEGVPSVDTWIEDHLQKMESVNQLLSENRYARWRKSNAHRVPHEYQEDDYVLIHLSRFGKSKKKAKFSSPYLGPFRVLSVEFGSLWVRTSPSLGGDIHVHVQHVKRFPHTILEDDDDDVFGLPDHEASRIDEADPAASSTPSVEPVAAEIPSEETTALQSLATYEVEAILQHKYRKTWKFLTKWRQWPVEDSTWENATSFVHPYTLAINQTFSDYCQQHGLWDSLRTARAHVERVKYVMANADI